MMRVLVPTDLDIAVATEQYVREWLTGFVQLDVEQQALKLAALRDTRCGCSFHEAMRDALVEFGARLARLRPEDEES